MKLVYLNNAWLFFFIVHRRRTSKNLHVSFVCPMKFNDFCLWLPILWANEQLAFNPSCYPLGHILSLLSWRNWSEQITKRAAIYVLSEIKSYVNRARLKLHKEWQRIFGIWLWKVHNTNKCLSATMNSVLRWKTYLPASIQNSIHFEKNWNRYGRYWT